MSAADIFPLVVRWLHLVSAAAWVGGSIFYLLVLRPALRRSGGSPEIAALAAIEFRGLVDTSIIVLVVTGAVLTFIRLSAGVVGAPYVIVLGVKIVLSLWMFAIALRRRRRLEPPPPSLETPRSVGIWRRFARAVSGYNMVALLGVVVFLLSDLLKTLFEAALAS